MCEWNLQKGECCNVNETVFDYPSASQILIGTLTGFHFFSPAHSGLYGLNGQFATLIAALEFKLEVDNV